MQRTKKITFLFMLMVILLTLAGSSCAAQNMISQAKKNKVSSGTWKETSKGRRFKGEDGNYLKDEWCTIDGKIYYFNRSGYVRKGWVTYQGKKYYEGKDGSISVRKWVKVEKNRYYMKKDGTRASNEWQKIDGKYYHFDAKGVMEKNQLIETGGRTYYVNKKGRRLINRWVAMEGALYFFGEDGVRVEDEWVRSGGNYYYLQVDGSMARQMWVDEYYVGQNGVRQTNCVVEGYHLNAAGKRDKVVNASKEFLIVGDSRVVGMKNAVPVSRAEFIGQGGKGYKWLKSTAGPLVRQYLARNPQLKVVFALGVNDIENSSLYIQYYKDLLRYFPRGRFYFLSVNPVRENLLETFYGITVKNKQIEAFNSVLMKTFPSRFLDSYTYLKEKGFSTLDGIHFTEGSYREIYNFILNNI